jgi:hypothetical protein
MPRSYRRRILTAQPSGWVASRSAGPTGKHRFVARGRVGGVQYQGANSFAHSSQVGRNKQRVSGGIGRCSRCRERGRPGVVPPIQGAFPPTHGLGGRCRKHSPSVLAAGSGVLPGEFIPAYVLTILPVSSCVKRRISGCGQPYGMSRRSWPEILKSRWMFRVTRGL